jgi:hypothetical protein
VPKTANILNKLPKSLHSKAKRALQEIWMAETKKDTVKAFDAFVENLPGQIQESYLLPDQGPRWATRVLRLSGRALEAFTKTNPIESTFATVRHRTIRSKGFLSNKRRSPWSSSWSRAPREIGAGSTAIISYQN